MTNKKLKNTILSWLLIFMAPLFMVSCVDDDDTDDKPGPTKVLHSYFASASYGDIVEVDVNKTDKKIDYNNITTSQKGSLNYNFLTNPELNSILQINQNGQSFFAIEDPGQIFVTSLPLGNIYNKLSFGITSKLNFNTDVSPAELAGKYVFVIFENVAPDEYEWGGYQINADGTYSWKISGEDEPELFNDKTGFSGDGGGTWMVDPQNSSRLIFKENNGNDVFYGSVLPGKMMMIDIGVGNGFVLGVKYPEQPYTQAQVAGKYQWIDKTPEGYVGLGYFNIPSDGDSCKYYYKYLNNPYADEGLETAYDFKRLSNMNNVFRMEDNWDGDIFYTYMAVLAGQSVIFFTIGDDGIVSVGIGIRSK